MTTFFVIALFLVGLLAGRWFNHPATSKKKMENLTLVLIGLLLFVLGLSVGFNDQVVSQLASLGLIALSLTIGASLGSMVLVFLFIRWFFKK
jgi:uncharacterized membrane protein YbjE (DUF340 family)